VNAQLFFRSKENLFLFVLQGAQLHSGHYGNYVPNPAMRLAQLLASMKDDNGKVLITGYYDKISLTPEEKAVLQETGDDESAIRKRVGIAKAETVGATYQEALQPFSQYTRHGSRLNWR
jgi:hypothetical protein